MAAIRAKGVFGYGAELLRQAFSPPTDANASVIAALVSTAAMFWNVQVVLLIILVVLGGAVDLWTGARRARLRSRRGEPGGFDRALLGEGASGKGAIFVALLFLGVSIDAVLTLIGSSLDLSITSVFRGLTPATTGLLAYRWAKELASIKQNIEETPGGRDSIWPAVRTFIDTIRFRMANPATEGLPDRRWDDNIPYEDRAWVLEQLAERRAKRKAEETG